MTSLTRPQADALRSVGRHGDLSRGQDGRTTTAVIRHLQAMGLVMVNPHTPRPGGWTAALTENGKRKLAEINGAGAAINTDDLGDLASLIHFQVGAWHDFGYEEPPTPDCATIPPLGQRSASAIKAGHEAIGDIDRLIARLHEVRAGLVSELRQDEDIRAKRS